MGDGEIPSIRQHTLPVEDFRDTLYFKGLYRSTPYTFFSDQQRIPKLYRRLSLLGPFKSGSNSSSTGKKSAVGESEMSQ